MTLLFLLVNELGRLSLFFLYLITSSGPAKVHERCDLLSFYFNLNVWNTDWQRQIRKPRFFSGLCVHFSLYLSIRKVAAEAGFNKLTNMYLKNIHTVISVFFLFTCLSCEKDEHQDIPVQLSIEHIFEPVITDMTSSSPISLPDGISSNISLINSQQELIRNISSDIIEETPLYENINYESHSLLSLKFRSFYKPHKIEYKIYKNSNGQISIRQVFFVSGSIYTNGYFIMSNFVTEKLNANDKISFEQSFSFEETTPLE